MTQHAPATQWQLEDTSADAYERYLVPKFFAPWAKHLTEVVALAPGERVLDVACGTGIVARHAAPRVGLGGTVVGLDRNEGMLTVARIAALEVQPVIEWRIGDAADLPFADQTFDVAFCQQGLQFFPDPVAALRELQRVLTPNGRLALAVWRSIAHSPGFVTLAEALTCSIGAEAGEIMRSPFSAWGRPQLRDLIHSAGFRDVHIEIGIGSARFPSTEEFLRQEAASSPLSGPVGALSADDRTALVRDLSERLREYTDDDGIVFPMETYVVVARG